MEKFALSREAVISSKTKIIENVENCSKGFILTRILFLSFQGNCFCSLVRIELTVIDLAIIVCVALIIEVAGVLLLVYLINMD